MMSLQVLDIERKFKNLEIMEDSDWKDIGIMEEKKTERKTAKIKKVNMDDCIGGGVNA